MGDFGESIRAASGAGRPTLLDTITAVKIFLPCLFPLFLGGCCLVLRVELSVEHGIQFLLQPSLYIFVKIIFAV